MLIYDICIIKRDAAFQAVLKESRTMKDHASREGAACITALPGETYKRGELRHYKPHFVRRRVRCHHLKG